MTQEAWPKELFLNTEICKYTFLLYKLAHSCIVILKASDDSNSKANILFFGFLYYFVFFPEYTYYNQYFFRCTLVGEELYAHQKVLSVNFCRPTYSSYRVVSVSLKSLFSIKYEIIISYFVFFSGELRRFIIIILWSFCERLATVVLFTILVIFA